MGVRTMTGKAVIGENGANVTIEFHNTSGLRRYSGLRNECQEK
jgi:hypothetical protein